MAREIEALRYMIEAVWDGDRAVGKAKQQIGELGDTTERVAQKSKTNWKAIGAAVAGAGVAIGAIGVAAGKAYQMIGEGADLLRAEDQFGRLAESIDSTADSLMGRLRDATRGMVTDAELVQSATQIMSLGLQDTEDGVTRLTSVAGQLGWDMNQVILTMANNSTMRLDALGLSIEDVQTKMKALEEQGFDADKAFDLAVIEAGEEKIKLLGDTADTTAGQMKILETAVGNATDEFKVELARGFAGGLAEISGNAAQAATDLQVLTGAVGGFFGKLAGGAIGVAAAQISADVVIDNAVALGLMSEQYARSLMQRQKRGDPGAADEVALYARRVDEFKQSADALHDSWGTVGDSAESASASIDMTTSAMARQHAAGMNYVAGLELAGIATANMRAETESAAWNAEHFGGTLLSLPDSLHSTADEAWLAAGGIGGVAAAADAAEQAVRDLEDALRGLSGEAIDFYSFSGNVSEAVGYAQRGARNQGSIGQYYGSGGGYDYSPGGTQVIPAPAAPSAPVGPGGGGPSPQIVVNANTREAAALALTILGVTRNAPLNARMGLAR